MQHLWPYCPKSYLLLIMNKLLEKIKKGCSVCVLVTENNIDFHFKVPIFTLSSSHLSQQDRWGSMKYSHGVPPTDDYGWSSHVLPSMATSSLLMSQPHLEFENPNIWLDSGWEMSAQVANVNSCTNPCPLLSARASYAPGVWKALLGFIQRQLNERPSQ